MSNLSYAQLKGLWLNAAKGTKYDSNSWASLMAAIAEAESGGNPGALNPDDNNGTQSSFGLWQISTGTHTPPAPNWADPAENARLAIGKLNSQGLTAWGTYDSGAYKAYLNGATTPDTNIPGNPSGIAAQTTAADTTDCLVPNPFGVSLPLVGSITAGPACVFSRSNARAFIGAGLLLLGMTAGIVGLAVLMAAAGQKMGGPVGEAAVNVSRKAAPYLIR